MLQTMLDLAFPKRSLEGIEGAWLTEKEFSELIRLRPVVLEATDLRRMRILHLDRIVSAARYAKAPLLRRALQSYKYGRVSGLGEEIARLLIRTSTLIIPTDDTTLCPVPLHWLRLFERGFNQAEVLARTVAVDRGWRCEALLRRSRSTGKQANRGGAERRVAMTDAFAARVEQMPRHVILVDDVATTGATLDACARVLKSAGAVRVEALTLACA